MTTATVEYEVQGLISKEGEEPRWISLSPPGEKSKAVAIQRLKDWQSIKHHAACRLIYRATTVYEKVISEDI